jgi:hypothetical protein
LNVKRGEGAVASTNEGVKHIARVSDVARDGEIMARYQRESLLDFSNVVGAIEPAQLTREHLRRYAAALDERGTDKLIKDVHVDNARQFLNWLSTGRRTRTSAELFGWYIGHCVARAKEWFKRVKR